MRAVMLMFDTLNRAFLPAYGADWAELPNFRRLQQRAVTFDNFYAGSMPCIPARREIHTGRHNFLHRSWGPLEPFDDSVISRLSRAGVYTHIVTDHFHYWEDGGHSFLSKYDSNETFRGQQGDLWIGQVETPELPDLPSKRAGTPGWRQDWINRSHIASADEMPTSQTVTAGLEFIRRNAGSQNWFLQIECFDPHEPFFATDDWREQFPTAYDGPRLDWPDYGPNAYDDELTEHIRHEYLTLLKLCDAHLGRLLDAFDEHSLWDDTMLIVNTDHGFLLGEHEQMGKNIQPFYNEIVHLPFFVHDPAHPLAGERRSELAQTVDIAPTLADFFGVEPPEYLTGASLRPVIAEQATIHDSALFGIHGAHVNVTDGRYVYMRAPHDVENGPLNEYTLAPAHMREPFSISELRRAELHDGFSFTQGVKLLKIPAETVINAYWWGHRLYDLDVDPQQLDPISDTEAERRMAGLLRDAMLAGDAPPEQYERLGIPMEGEISDEHLVQSDELGDLIRARLGDAVEPDAVRAGAMWLELVPDAGRDAAVARLAERLASPAVAPITLERVTEAVAALEDQTDISHLQWLWQLFLPQPNQAQQPVGSHNL